MGRVVVEGALEISAGAERVRLDGFDADVGAPDGAEVLVFFDRPSTATLHVYAREIADGSLTCSLGARRAAVTVDVALLADIVAEALGEGLELPQDAARRLRERLAAIR
jgi:hypothetical protein